MEPTISPSERRKLKAAAVLLVEAARDMQRAVKDESASGIAEARGAVLSALEMLPNLAVIDSPTSDG